MYAHDGAYRAVYGERSSIASTTASVSDDERCAGTSALRSTSVPTVPAIHHRKHSSQKPDGSLAQSQLKLLNAPPLPPVCPHAFQNEKVPL